MNSKKVVSVFLPDGSRGRIFAGRVKQVVLGANRHQYQKWIKKMEPLLFANIDERLSRVTSRPQISIIVPCYNTPQRYLDDLLQSVKDQVYDNWQLCMADGSTDEAARAYIQESCEKDDRITYIKVGENRGIVGNTNEGLSAAKGKYVAFMDHDDVLSPYALAEVAIKLQEKPGTELIYTDEDKLSDNGKKRLLPFFKPDWSPEFLLGVNYITHFVVAKKELVHAIGGLRPGLDGAQDYDFLLRITEKTTKIEHIPKILYHWRMAAGSTAKTVDEKSYAADAGQQALSDAMKRRKLKANVAAIQKRPSNYHVSFALPASQPKVSIIIPFKDKVSLLKQCVGSILKKTTYKNYEIILISNNSEEPSTYNYLEKLKQHKQCKVHIWDHPFNYSKINNYGRRQATGEYIVLLNNDTEVITPSWLDELVGVASQKGIGAVGPLLRYPKKTIQHAGVVLGMTGMAGHVFRGLLPENWTEFGMPAWPRNYLAVTAACLVVQTKKYDEVGGLDETFTIAGNDVALGIQLHRAGYRNVYWPFAELIHYENVSVGSYKNVPQKDYDHSLTYYRPYLENGDPFFNSNLDLMHEEIRLRRSS